MIVHFALMIVNQECHGRMAIFSSDHAEIEEMLEQESSEYSLGDGEIWDDCSDEESEYLEAKNVVVGICFFLQLFYKVSERAILALLLFLHSSIIFWFQ